MTSLYDCSQVNYLKVKITIFAHLLYMYTIFHLFSSNMLINPNMVKSPGNMCWFTPPSFCRFSSGNMLTNPNVVKSPGPCAGSTLD